MVLAPIAEREQARCETSNRKLKWPPFRLIIYNVWFYLLPISLLAITRTAKQLRIGAACKVPFWRLQSAVSSLTKCRFVARESTVRLSCCFSFFTYHLSLITFHFSLFIFHFSLFTFHFSFFTFHFKIILPSYHRSLKPRCTKGWGMVGCPSPSSHHSPIFAPHPPTILRCMGGSWEDDRLHPPMLNRPVHRHSSHLWYDGRMICKFRWKYNQRTGHLHNHVWAYTKTVIFHLQTDQDLWLIHTVMQVTR